METKQHGLMEYSQKLIKLSVNIVDKYLTSVINHGISRSYFSDGAKRKTGKIRKITVQRAK